MMEPYSNASGAAQAANCFFRPSDRGEQRQLDALLVRGALALAMLVAGTISSSVATAQSLPPLVPPAGQDFTLACPGAPVSFRLNNLSGDASLSVTGLNAGGNILAEIIQVVGTGQANVLISDENGFENAPTLTGGNDSETIDAIGAVSPRQLTMTKQGNNNNTLTVRISCGDPGPGADLTIMKSHEGDATQGQTGFQYSIEVSNTGAAPSSGTVTVTDTLPAGLTATSISGLGWTCPSPPLASSLTCTRSDPLGAGQFYPKITLTVDVAADAISPQTNIAIVGGGGDGNTGNNQFADNTIVNVSGSPPDLSIIKSHAGNAVQGQSGFQYTILVTNEGNGPTSGEVSVTDSLPTGLTAETISGDGWACALDTLTCTRSDVLSSKAEYPPIILTVKVADDAVSPQVNTVTVKGDGDGNPENDTATDSTLINKAGLDSDPAITKDGPSTAEQGQTGISYSLVVSNEGGGPTSGVVTVNDALTLAPGLKATAILGDGWTCALGTLTCTRSDILPPGASYPPIFLTANVLGDAAGSQTNTATVSGGVDGNSEGDPNTDNNTASKLTEIRDLPQQPDLAIDKSHRGSAVRGQNGFQYTLLVSNEGTGPASGLVTVTDVLPDAMAATVMSGDGWNCDSADLTCTRSDSLPAGASYPPITLTVTVDENAPDLVVNVATVEGGSEASNPLNNMDEDPTTIDEDKPVKDAFESLSYNFIAQRLNLIAANGPRLAWLVNRLEGGFGGGTNGFNVVGENGDITGSFAFSSRALSKAVAGERVVPTADSLRSDGGVNAWIEGQFAIYNDGRDDDDMDTEGDFFIGYAGIDLEVIERVNVGIMAEVDWMSEDGEDNAEVEGTGWMIGPYLSAEIAPGLFLDMRAMGGRTDNSIRQAVNANDYKGDFQTDRWLAEATLSGNYNFEAYSLTPDVRLLHIRENQENYMVRSALNTVDVNGNDVMLTQLSGGLRISRMIETDDMMFRPYAAGRLFWNIDNPGELTVDGEYVSTDDMRGAVTLGLDAGSDAMQFGLEGTYDGLFGDNDHAIGGRLSFGYRF